MKSNLRCVVLLGLLAAPAWGQTPAAIDCESNAACVALYEQAQQQSKAGQLAEAEKSYKLAYEVSHDARLLFNIARVLDKRGQAEEAMSYYRQFLQAPVQDETQKAKAREFLAQLEANRKPPEPPKNEPTMGVTPTQVTTVDSAVQSTKLPTAQTSEQTATPVYKKGWLWGVLVGTVAAVGLGVGLGVGLSNRTPMVPSGTNTIAF